MCIRKNGFVGRSPPLFSPSRHAVSETRHISMQSAYLMGERSFRATPTFFRLVEERLSDIVTHLTQTLIEGHILSERSRVDRPRLYVTLRSYVSQYPRGAVKRVVDQLGWLNPFRIAECGTDRRPLALRRPRRPPRY